MAGPRPIAGSRLRRDGARRGAIGLDLGGPVLEVARRGFSSTFSNQMGRLGAWSATPQIDGQFDGQIDGGANGWTGSSGLPAVGSPTMPVLRLVDDLIGNLLDADPAGAQLVSVGLAAPGWIGWCDRHHIAQLVDPHRRCELVWASSPAVAVLASSLASAQPFASELVVAIDLDVGISAAVVTIDRTGVRELLAASAAPNRSERLDAVAAVVTEIAALAREAGMLGANRIVLVADDHASGAMVEQTMRALDRAWADCPVDIVRTRADIARAAVVLAEMDTFHVVGATPRGVGVLLEDADAGRSSVHLVVPRNTSTPVRTTASFDVGPDDGADVYLDVYEEQPDRSGSPSRPAERRGHRLIMTTRLAFATDASRDENTDDAENDDDANDDDGDDPVDRSVGGVPRVDEVPRVEGLEMSFVVGSDGQLRVEPTKFGDHSTWTSSWAISRLVRPSLPMDGRQGPLWLGTIDIPSTQHPLEAVVHSEPAVPRPPPARHVAREMAPPLALSEALGRVERVISRQVGRLVAIRSAMALFGSADRDDLEVVHERADRLQRALDRCPDDDASRAVHAAADVARRALDSPATRVYAGGTFSDVVAEIERVVEHLSIVIGAVTPAERNRLVLDAQLLGLDIDRSRSVVDELIDIAGVDSDGRPDQLRDVTATVVVSAQGFRLDDADVRLDHDQAGIRVLLFE